MKILIFSDKNYEYQVDYFLQFIELHNIDCEVLYYTIGFNSSLDKEFLIKKFWKINDNYKGEKEPGGPIIDDFHYYKPEIFLDALKFGDEFLFMDTDIVIGKRFKLDLFKNNYDFPLLSIGNLDYPIRFAKLEVIKQIWNKNLVEVDEMGVHTGIPNSVIFNEAVLMDYFGIKERTMTYVFTSIVSFNKKCEDFIREWKSIVDNEWIRSKGYEYLPFWEETAINIVLWRRKININLGRIFVNTLFFDVIKTIEENDDIIDQYINGVNVHYCENSSKCLFYHGIKDKEELEKTLNYFK